MAICETLKNGDINKMFRFGSVMALKDALVEFNRLFKEEVKNENNTIE